LYDRRISNQGPAQPARLILLRRRSKKNDPRKVLSNLLGGTVEMSAHAGARAREREWRKYGRPGMSARDRGRCRRHDQL
jgi:hypothetical protein